MKGILILVERENAATAVHASEDKALKEAFRLARVFPTTLKGPRPALGVPSPREGERGLEIHG